MTLTIKLPGDLEERLAPLSEEERERFTVEALREKIEEDERDIQASYSLTPEDLADIGEGLADADAGRVVDGDAFFKEMNDRLARLKAAKQQDKAA
jgi:predicted transcriptional regulator